MTLSFFHPKTLLIIFLLVFVLFLRYLDASSPKDSSWINAYNEKGVLKLQGKILAVPQIKRAKQAIEVADLKVLEENNSQKQLKGKILVYVGLYPAYHFGDVIAIVAELKTPPVFNEFNYQDFLEIEGIYSIVNYPKIQKIGNLSNLGFLYVFREKLETIINNSLPEPHASLLAGILFGMERNFDPGFYTKLRNVGILHVIVASGYNISVVLGAVFVLAYLLGRKLTMVLAIITIVIYSMLTGLQPPIIRAALMAGGGLLAETFGRQRSGLLWLFLAGYLMLIWNPLWIQSVSFQLSFLATLAVIVIKPQLDKVLVWLINEMQAKWFTKQYATPPKKGQELLKNFFAEALVITIAVQILTMPVILWNFKQVALISFLVNPLILWTIPLIMGGGAVLVLAGFVSIQLSYLLGLVLWLPLEYFVRVVSLFG